MDKQIRRKRIEHFNIAGHAHLLTFSTYKRRPLLTNRTWNAWLSESINRAATRHFFDILAFVYMPEHVHLVVLPSSEDYDISRFLFALKRPFLYRVKNNLRKRDGTLLESLMVRERPGRFVFRFWQAGGGYDRNITSLEEALRTAEYIHNNPVRRGLSGSPDNWTWSSWKWYHRREEYDTSLLPRIRVVGV